MHHMIPALQSGIAAVTQAAPVAHPRRHHLTAPFCSNILKIESLPSCSRGHLLAIYVGSIDTQQIVSYATSSLIII